MSVNYSLIVPIYNEAETLLAMYERVAAVMEQLPGVGELLLIDDGSRDTSLSLMRQLQQQDARVVYLSFARNFGHQVAVTAGLNFARGDVVVILDADLQDPPELIPDMLKLWEQGYQVVYAQRTRRQKESWLKRWTAFWFYRTINHLADIELPKDSGDFCLMDRRVVDLLNAMPERNRYIRGLRAWVGFKQTAILFERQPRYAGDVKYTFTKSLQLAMNSIISFSRVPLRLATYVGLFSAGIALLMMLLVIYWRFFQPGSRLIGFSLIAGAVFFLGAVQLICIGILGEYIGQIFEEVKGRPLYTLKEVCGFDTTSPLASKQETGLAR
jgi:dolichol-phosphate mannosyltransferase